MKKISLITLLSLLVLSCGGGSESNSGPSGDDNTGPAPNTKTIYFEDDLDADPTLVMGADDLAIAYVYTEKATNRSIPFTVPQAGNYDLCIDQADNVLHAKIIDELGTELVSFTPSYSLECKSIDLSAQQYDLVLTNAPRFNSIIFYDDISDWKRPSTSYIRTNEKRQIFSDVTEDDWNNGLNIIKLSLGLSQNASASNNISHRRCYTVPLSVRSPVAFRQDGDKLLVSFRADYNDGEKKTCTYVEADNLNPPSPTSAGDIGDIDSIVVEFVEATEIENDIKQLNYSRPRKGDSNVSVGSDVVIGFEGVLDRLSKDQAFTISPSVSGTADLKTNVFTFNSDTVLENDTEYTVTLSGLSDNEGNPANDIRFSFKTEKQFNVSGTETTMSNEEFCALGVKEYCETKQFSSITDLSVNILNSVSAGSRHLEVQTTLDQTNSADIIVEYVISTDTGELVKSSGFVIEAGKLSDTNFISLKEIDFDKTIKNVTVTISVKNAVYELPTELGSWAIYNGEFFTDSASVVENNFSVAVSSLEILPGITEHDRKLVFTLNEPAAEEVYLQVGVAAIRTLLSGTTSSQYYSIPNPVSIAVGEQQVTVDVEYGCLSSLGCIKPTTYRSDLTISVVNSRNADYSSLTVINETIYVADAAVLPTALAANLNATDNLQVDSYLQATDPNQLPLTYQIVQQPAYGSLTLNNADTGSYSYAVDSVLCNDTCTSDSFIFRVNNGFGYSAEAAVSVAINRDALVPIAVDGTIDATEDTVASSVLLASVVDGFSNTFSIVSQGTKGTVVITDAQAGNYTYTPNTNAFGTDSFSFTVSNANGSSPVTATVLVTILPQDDASVVQDITITIDEDIDYSAVLPVTELDGDVLTLTKITEPALGNFYYWSSTGKIEYRPHSNKSGIDTFSYKVNDGISDSNTATVTVTINPINDAPTQLYSADPRLASGTSVSATLKGSDVEGDPLTFIIVTQPVNGSVTVVDSTTGGISVSANAGITEFTKDSFSYKISDGQDETSVFTKSISIYADSATPAAFDRSFTMDENGVLNQYMSANMLSGYSSTLVYEIVGQPVNGVVSLTGGAGFSYSPNTNFIGTDSFTYTAAENGVVSNVATITITVNDVEFVPAVTYSEHRVATGESVSDTLSATDGDGDTITYSISTQPTSGTVVLDAVSGDYTYTSTSVYPTADYFIWTATDSKGNAASAMVFFTVFDAANAKPIVNNLTMYDFNAGEVVAGDILMASYAYSDAEGDPESISRLRWLLNGVEIDGETSAYYTIKESDVGHTISFDVLPAAESGREFGDITISTGVTVVSPELFLGMNIGLKQLQFSWLDTTGAAYFKLLEDPDGASGYSQAGVNLTTASFDLDISVPGVDWDNAKYILQACDSLDVCIDSNELSTFVYDALNDERAIGYFKASNTQSYDEFGSVLTVSADGNTMVVGAPGEDSSASGVDGDQLNNDASDAGAAYVFTKVDGAWMQQAYLKASSPYTADGFGASVAVSADGNTLAIGAYKGSTSVFRSGSVTIFTRSAGVWVEQVILQASNAELSDRFGTSVGISGDGTTLVVGANYEDSAAKGVNGDGLDNNASGSGAAYVFKQSTGVWSQQAYLKASNTEASDYFGSAVSISADGSTVAVGADFEDSAAIGVNGNDADNSSPSSGAVYVFVESAGVWSQQAYVKASNTDSSDYFGSSLSLSGDGNTLVVSAIREDSAATGVNGDETDNTLSASGAVYSFNRSAGVWSQQAYVKASNAGASDLFGMSVSISDGGSALVVGAGSEDSVATGVNGDELDNSKSGSGAVYLFMLEAGSWVQQSYIKPSNLSVYNFGGSVDLSSDASVIAVGAPSEQSNATGINGDQTDSSLYDAGAVYLY